MNAPTSVPAVASSSRSYSLVLDLYDAQGLVLARRGERELHLPPVVCTAGSLHEAGGDESVDYAAGAGAGVADEHVAEFPECQRSVVRDDAQYF